jgi:hypothetical protein
VGDSRGATGTFCHQYILQQWLKTGRSPFFLYHYSHNSEALTLCRHCAAVALDTLKRSRGALTLASNPVVIVTHG